MYTIRKTMLPVYNNRRYPPDVTPTAVTPTPAAAKLTFKGLDVNIIIVLFTYKVTVTPFGLHCPGLL